MEVEKLLGIRAIWLVELIQLGDQLSRKGYKKGSRMTLIGSARLMKVSQVTRIQKTG